MRAAVFLLLAFSCGMSKLYAHALPGSVLTFSQHEKGLELAITFPLEDLAIASPQLESLKALPVGSDISGEYLSDLKAYVEEHLSLGEDDEELPFTLQSASLKDAYHDHLGYYTLVALNLIFPSEIITPATSLELSYDVIMHEVRNHRAHVYWSDSDQSARKIAYFGFRRVNGEVQKHLLKR
ncbi:hypothetical protein OFY17_14635 [Marinomonas sp. C2222]|uniref:Uncharacterized protein n=1 Tax=Marinomonas sargassi TaxID=2984494 RepID=A0ABT2YW29_9GAMM|nr:hypothetical protein [Marinomonas sargassi]MCV2404100.1 hypothetical protein [Marinomonas sargassi]